MTTVDVKKLKPKKRQKIKSYKIRLYSISTRVMPTVVHLTSGYSLSLYVMNGLAVSYNQVG